MRRVWVASALLCGASTASAALVEGEALYRARIMPPPAAVLVVTIEDSGRAGAPAIELESSRMRLAGGPLYRWRLEYDERLLKPEGRLGLRARIDTPGGLWMTTTEFTPASATAAVLQLHTVAATEDRCASSRTQPDLTRCAYDEFLDASHAMSQQLHRIETSLKPAKATSWRQVQKAWLMFRTQSCQFESSAAGNGSVQPMLQWQCAARKTRERTAELTRLTNCPEGDVACPLRGGP